MKITREDMPGRQIALTIELDPETINGALDRAYRQMVNQVNVPGFRRGKAPRYMLERYVGKDMLTERAVRNIIPQTLQDAITEQNIEAMDVGDFEIINMEPVEVKVVVIQPPLIELGDYKAIRVERDKLEEKPEQVDEVIMELRRESAPWEEPAEPRPIKEGDMVYLDLEGFTSQGELEDAKREDFPTIVGVERAGVPEVVNKALEGMSVGEEKDVVETIPEDFPAEDLRGLDVSYHVTVRSIKEPQLPEVDEDFARKLGFDTVEAMRETIARNLRQRAQDAAEEKQFNTAIGQMVESSKVEVPDMMVNEEVDALQKSLEERLKQQRLTLRQFLTFSGINESEWREANRPRALSRIVTNLVLQEFARSEGISVEDTEVESEIAQVLDSYEGQEKEQARTLLDKHEQRHQLEDRIYQRKVLNRLLEIIEGRGESSTTSEAEQDTSPEASEKARKPKAKAKTAASDLEEAGGAAEVLDTGSADIHSENETGQAPGGGTPDSAPALDA